MLKSQEVRKLAPEMDPLRMGMGWKEEDLTKPQILIESTYGQSHPGSAHLLNLAQKASRGAYEAGGKGALYFATDICDGMAQGHDGINYSLPSRDIIADSVEYMVNAHKADAMICISNCDKITPGMLMASMRLNIPTVFVSGGPMEAHKINGENADLITAMIKGADTSVSDEEMAKIEACACPGCGSCSGMFTANSMNCLNEALGLALPGNGTIVATHTNRRRLFEKAASLIVQMAGRYYFEGDDSVLPRNIATKAAFENAMSLDIAMGGSTNTVLHLLAIAHEAGVDFTMQDIDRLSRKVPVLCKVAPNSHFHIQDVNRAGGILSILGELAEAGLIDTTVNRVGYKNLAECLSKYNLKSPKLTQKAQKFYLSAPGGKFSRELGSQSKTYARFDTDR
ncbi:MAG TPA: dihydroxy-acid dehydratase, partial [Ruminococcaceae bacterium]|nr:dihydroxy-acid dehydratase [Oscillospiraceae bacterium]